MENNHQDNVPAPGAAEEHADSTGPAEQEQGREDAPASEEALSPDAAAPAHDAEADTPIAAEQENTADGDDESLEVPRQPQAGLEETGAEADAGADAPADADTAAQEDSAAAEPVEVESAPEAEADAGSGGDEDADLEQQADVEAASDLQAEDGSPGDAEPENSDPAAQETDSSPEGEPSDPSETGEDEESRLVIPFDDLEEESDSGAGDDPAAALEEIDSQSLVAEGPKAGSVGADTTSGTEEDEDVPTAVTTLEYLETPRKDGEEEDTAPRFSSVGEAKAVLEGFLFTTNEPLSVNRLSKLCGNLHPKTVRGLLLELQMDYDGRPGGLQVVEVAGGFQMATRPHIAEWMFRLHKHRRKSPLSPATLETLAIIAYKQPVTKGEVEAIRGVESGGTFRTLQDLSLIDVGGRREVPGRPQLYVTTPYFLKAFGLNSLADLPSISELRHRFADEQKLKAPLPAPVRLAESSEDTADTAAQKPNGALPPIEISPTAAAEELDEQSVEASHEPSAEAETAEGTDGREAEAQPAEEGAAATVEDIPTSGETTESDSSKGEAQVISPFSDEEVEAARREAEGTSENAQDEAEEFDDDEEFEEDEEEDNEELTGDDADEVEPVDETPVSPEDEIPPPQNTPIGRVPKPPRKGGWGVGRPLFGEEDDE